MSTNTDFTTSSAMSTPREIGYAVVSGGDQAGSPIALVLPSGCVPQNVRVDVAREVVNLDTLSGPAFLRGTPLALRKALQRADSTVTIFTVDTLTEIQAVWSKEQVHVREMGDAGIRDALNSFLGRIAAGQSAEATKHRVRFRHPEIEAFIRKMLATLAKAAPKLKTQVRAVDIKPLSENQTGPASVAMLSLNAMSQHSALGALCAGFEANGQIEAPDGHQSTLADFALVHSASYAYLTRLSRQSETVVNGFASFGAAMLKKDTSINQYVLSAADSIFLQSYRDSFACLALSRLDSKHALALLDAVTERRSQAGDFSVFAKAPMSHNTAEALSVTRQLLASQATTPRTGLESVHAAALGIAIAATESELAKSTDPATAAAVLRASERTLGVVTRQAA